MAPVTGVRNTATCVHLHHLIRSGRIKMTYQDNPQPPQEDDEVFDTENAPMDGEYLGQPDEGPAVKEIPSEEQMNDVDWFAQEAVGSIKTIEVQADAVTIDGKVLTPKEFASSLQAGFALFGPYTLVVFEYKDGAKKKYSISQAIVWKGIDLSRTVTSVRLSAVREIYGFLVNQDQKDRVSIATTVRTLEEKQALEDPFFFHANRGYDQT